MFQLPTIKVNDYLPDGVMAGFDALGRVIVCLEYEPHYHYIVGSDYESENVAEWHVCSTHARRLAMVEAWRDADYVCRGNA